MDACDEAATSQKQNSGSCGRRGNEEVEEHSADTGHKMELADEETRKRAVVEPTDDDDDEPAEKYWRAEDFVAKASMDELTGTWITDEKGILDEDAAGDTWTDCLGAGGELD